MHPVEASVHELDESVSLCGTYHRDKYGRLEVRGMNSIYSIPETYESGNIHCHCSVSKCQVCGLTTLP